MKVKDACVIYWGQIREVIGNYDREKLSWEQVLSIRDCILSSQMEPGRETNREHRRNVHKIRGQNN